MIEEHHDLPDGLARHLVDARDSGVMTDSQLMSQLGMLVVSYETQAASAASLIGMLLEHDLYGYAARPSRIPNSCGESSPRVAGVGEDVLVAMLTQLPDDVHLDHDGKVLRETAGISWTIPRLLVSPRPAS
ncbi:hypothetical protein [Micromonospora sp. NPDC048830]|uniref:hypothetical protein n=1 Tax=Micromonospora sp. NPDC048830 TaxID=3364257 RepID=UPI00371DE806